MNQTAGFLRGRPDVGNTLQFGKNWPQQIAEAANLMQDIEAVASKELTYWGHPVTTRQASIGTWRARAQWPACTRHGSTAARVTVAVCCGVHRTKSMRVSSPHRMDTAHRTPTQQQEEGRRHRVPLLFRGGRTLPPRSAAVHRGRPHQGLVLGAEHARHAHSHGVGDSQDSHLTKTLQVIEEEEEEETQATEATQAAEDEPTLQGADDGTHAPEETPHIHNLKRETARQGWLHQMGHTPKALFDTQRRPCIRQTLTGAHVATDQVAGCTT